MSPKKQIEDRFLNNQNTALHTNLFPDVQYPLFCIINLVLQPLVTGCFVIKLGSPPLLLIEDAKLPFPICYPAYHQACLGNYRVFHHLSASRSENPSSNSCHIQYIATDPIASWKDHQYKQMHLADLTLCSSPLPLQVTPHTVEPLHPCPSLTAPLLSQAP